MCEPLSLALYFLLPDYLVKVQECRYCGECYKESDNIGRHLCRIHPGIRVSSNTGFPPCVFYSCCGRSVLAKGCLQIDHTTCAFSERDVERRLRGIQAFATTIVPHLLLRFLTCPLPTSVLYDTGKPTTERYFDAQFPVLREVALRTQSLLITHAPQFLDPGCYNCYEDGEEEGDHSEIGVKTFDVIEEARILFINSRESALFTALRDASITKTQSELLTACDKAWRNRLGSLPEDPGGVLPSTRCHPSETERVPFLLISRIHCKLDVFLK